MSLMEYRQQYPHTSSDPTLSQSSLLAQVLERQHKRALRLALRREKRRMILAAPARACAWMWLVLKTTFQQRPAKAAPQASPSHSYAFLGRVNGRV